MLSKHLSLEEKRGLKKDFSKFIFENEQNLHEILQEMKAQIVVETRIFARRNWSTPFEERKRNFKNEGWLGSFAHYMTRREHKWNGGII